MKAENVDFGKSVPLVIPIFEYDAALRERAFKQMLLFSSAEIEPDMRKIFNKLRKGYTFMQYGEVLTDKESNAFEAEMELIYGPEWTTLGFSKTSKTKLVDDTNDRVLFLDFRITQYMSWINLLGFLEDTLLSKIEYLTFSDVVSGNQILIDGNPNFDKHNFVKNDDKYNLPLYAVDSYNFKTTNLFQPISLTQYMLVRCDNYKNLLDNFIYDEYKTGSIDATAIYQQHIRILLPMLNPDSNFNAAIRLRDERRSAFPEYYNYLHDEAAAKDIMNGDKHINELFTFNNIKLITFKYDLIPTISNLYPRNKTTTERIFDAIETSKDFPVSIISNHRGGTFSAKIYKPEKITFNHLVETGQLEEPVLLNTVIFYNASLPQIEKFIVTISDESELRVTIYNHKNVSITTQLFDQVFAIINTRLISQLWDKRTSIYPLYVDEIQHPTFAIENISMFTAHINTPFAMSLREFNQIRTYISRATSGVFDSVNTSDILQLQDAYAGSKFIIKYGTTLSIYIKRFVNMTAYNLLENLILKTMGVWYAEHKTLDKGSTQISKIKLLKAVDPNRFDFEPTNPSDKYATRVQKNKQPTPMSLKKAIADGYTEKQYVTLDNLTFPNRKDTFVCVSEEFKYIGFVRSLSTMYNICAPGCFRGPQHTKKSTRIIYNKCIGKVESGTKTKSNESQKSIQSAYYVGKYDTQITTGKYYSLPWELNKQLGVGQSETQSVVSKSSAIHLIYGGEPNGLISLINRLLSVDFVADVKAEFKRDPSAFLKIQEKFGDKFVLPENYIMFLENEHGGVHVSHGHIAPLISLLYPDVGFFIIIPHGDGHLVDFIGLGGIGRLEIFKHTGDDNERIFVVVLKDNIYSSIVFVENKQRSSILPPHDRLITLLRSFYDPNNALKYNPQYIPTRVKFNELVDVYSGSQDISIEAEDNSSVDIRIGKALVTGYYQIPSDDVKLSNIKDALNLLAELNVDVIVVYRNSKKQLTYILGDHNIIIPLTPVAMANYSGQFEIALYEPIVMTTKTPSYPRELVELAYDKHIEYIALQALNQFIRGKRNPSVRNKILLMIKKSKLDQLETINSITPHDAMLIRDIYANKKETFRRYFDNIQFAFEINDMRKKYTNPIGFNERINDLVDTLVIVRKHTSEIDTPSTTCYMDAKSTICYRGKLIVSKKGKQRVSVLFNTLFSNNEFLREVLLNSSIPNLARFTTSENEMLKTLTLG